MSPAWRSHDPSVKITWFQCNIHTYASSISKGHSIRNTHHCLVRCSAILCGDKGTFTKAHMKHYRNTQLLLLRIHQCILHLPPAPDYPPPPTLTSTSSTSHTHQIILHLPPSPAHPPPHTLTSVSSTSHEGHHMVALLQPQLCLGQWRHFRHCTCNWEKEGGGGGGDCVT